MLPKSVNSYIYLFGILLVGFIVYFFIKDYIFIPSIKPETFEIPAPASVEIRQAPLYSERKIQSGPTPPSQEARDEIVVYGEPNAKDPYYEPQESSDIPENLRHPERSFRPPPVNNNTNIAVEAGIAGNSNSVVTPEFIQGGGEFMPGIFANDTLSDKSYSDF